MNPFTLNLVINMYTMFNSLHLALIEFLHEHLNYAYMILKNVENIKKIDFLHWYSYLTIYCYQINSFSFNCRAYIEKIKD